MVSCSISYSGGAKQKISAHRATTMSVLPVANDKIVALTEPMVSTTDSNIKKKIHK
jgi:hypothetical protein